jgi:hypothetical protein
MFSVASEFFGASSVGMLYAHFRIFYLRHALWLELFMHYLVMRYFQFSIIFNRVPFACALSCSSVSTASMLLCVYCRHVLILHNNVLETRLLTFVLYSGMLSHESIVGL